MKIFLTSAVLVVLYALTINVNDVQAATCSEKTDSKCTATDFTKATCTGGVCDCKTGYVAIPTGCAAKLTTPKVTVPSGRTENIIKDTTGVLTCEGNSDGGSVEYMWFKNGQEESNEISQTYTIKATDTATDATTLKFQCQLKAADANAQSVNSDRSNEVAITVQPTDYTFTPQVSVESTTALEGTPVTLMCNNIPMGVNAKFWTDTGRASEKTLPYQFETADSEGLIYCGTATQLSTAGDLPKMLDDIEKVTVGIAGQSEQELFYHSSASAPTLSCTPDPAKGTAAITKTYMNGTTPITTIDMTNGKYYTVKCTGQLGSNPSKTSSNTIKITISDDYVTKPTLTATATKPLQESRVVLTCGEVMEDVTYSWEKDNAAIPFQKDRMIQLGTFTTGDNGVYKCTIHKGSTYVTESDAVTISAPSAAIDTPVITRKDGGTTFGEKGDYVLQCTTDSYTDGMVFEWMKDTKTLDGETKVDYTIEDASGSKHNGTYTCKATFDSLTSAASTGLQVRVVEPGKACTQDTDCTSVDGSTGKCGTETPKRCVCKEDYTMEGSACVKSGVSTIVGSAMLVLVAFIFSCIF